MFSTHTDTNVRHIAGRVTGRTRRGNIYSPNYPLDYDSNTECIWKISVPENAALRLHFEKFNTECLQDYLEIHHVNTAAGTTTRYAPYTYHCKLQMLNTRSIYLQSSTSMWEPDWSYKSHHQSHTSGHSHSEIPYRCHIQLGRIQYLL